MVAIPDGSSQIPRFDRLFAQFSALIYTLPLRHPGQKPRREDHPLQSPDWHRIKDNSVPAAKWVHSRLKALHQLPDDWTLSQCLFGEHLLSLCPDLPVALVEAEKTAVICSAVFPEFLWLSTGGLDQFNDRVKVLLGR